MELRSLRYFVAVVDAGGFSPAALKLEVGQPSLSEAIASLEQELSIELLARGARGVAVTDAGAALYGHAQRLLRMAEQAADVVHRRLGNASGRVRLGLPVSIGQMISPRLVERSRELYPAIRLELFEHLAQYDASQLLSERLDVCVLLNEESPDGEIVSAPLLQERCWFVRRRDAGPPLPRSVTLETVVEYPQVTTTRTTAYRALIARQFSQAKLQPTIAAESNSGATLLSMVAEGVGATLLPYSIFATFARLDELETRLVEPPFYRYASLCHARQFPLSPAGESIRALVRETCAQLIHGGHWKATTMSDRDD